MQNSNHFTKVELRDDPYAWGYIRGCLDTVKRFHQFPGWRRRQPKPGSTPTPAASPSFVIVIRRAAVALLLAAFAFSITACTQPRPQHGGRALTTPNPAAGLSQSLVQSDNPSQPSRQTQDFTRTRTYTTPVSTFERDAQSGPPLPSQGRGVRGEGSHYPVSTIESRPSSIQYLASLVTETEQSHALTELGAAQKDTAREFTAKLSSLKSIVWVGVALFILGIATFAWPPLRAIIGSLTTSAAITLGGLALMVLPTLIVGNELLILGGVTVAVGGWFIAHRHGHLRGQLHAAAPKRAADASRITHHAPPSSMAAGS